MNPPDLPPGFDVSSWRKKKRIWITNIVLSSICLLTVPSVVIGMMSYSMNRTFSTVGSSGADVSQLSDHINQTMIVATIGAVVGLLVLIWLAVSIAMFCLIPKPFNGMIR